MTKFRSVKSALLTSVVSLFLCVAMLVGSTFAWFTDSVTSGQNVIKTGTLDIKLEYSVLENGVWTDYAEVTDTTDIFGYDNWEPGYVEVAKFRITNIGSLAIKYSLTADVYSETAGVNVNGDEFLLSDYLYTEVVAVDATREDILASTTGSRLKAPIPVSTDPSIVNDDLIVSNSNLLQKNAVEEVALAIWMPTTVGNEANYREVQPSITFGINLVATQAMNEVDSFGNDYDAAAADPIIAWGSEAVTGASLEIPLMKANGGKVGSATVQPESVDPTAENFNVRVIETAVNPNLTIADDSEARTFDISVDGLVDGNTTKVKVQLYVGTGLTGVKVYHKTQEMTDAVYTNDGYVIFETASFSPFTVTYDAVATEIPEDQLKKDVPVAELTDADIYENVNIAWSGKLITPNNTDLTLNTVYKFSAPHDSETVDYSIYKDWYCDYYVMLKTNDANFTTLPENTIILGGEYGEWGWNGFENPEVETNTYIPLLATAVGAEDVNRGFTYDIIVSIVKEFHCGVGVANTENFDITETDAEFVVELRLTNPDDLSDYVVCNKVVYTFATGESVISNYPDSQN